MKDDRGTFMKLSDSAMDDWAISMRTSERGKVMGDRAYLYENFREGEGDGRPGLSL